MTTHTPASAPPAMPPQRKKREVTPETRKEIVRLHEWYGSRQIALRVNESRKVVRRVLQEEGCTSIAKGDAPSFLTPFLEPIQERALKGLTISRIYREIRELGYRGRRTILAQRVREIRVQHAIQLPRKKVSVGSRPIPDVKCRLIGRRSGCK